MQETLKKTNLVKRLSKNNYLVTINNKEYKLHTETIIKYNLLSSDIKYSSEEIIDLDKKMRTNVNIDKYFIKYPKSVKEAKYLMVNKYNIDNYDYIIDRLIKYNILNDNRLRLNIIAYLEDKNYGPNYINNYLYSRGLENNYDVVYTIDELIIKFDKLLKNYKGNKDKKYRYLFSRGYKINDINLYFNHKN